jgi:hypothetical protein
MTYVADADPECDPVLYRPWVWDEVKRALTQHVTAYLRHHLSPPAPPSFPGPRLQALARTVPTE